MMVTITTKMFVNHEAQGCRDFIARSPDVILRMTVWAIVAGLNNVYQ